MTNNNTPQLDLFISDLLTFSPKSDQASLEHPLFSIAKRKDLNIRNYRSPDGKVWVEVVPSVKGAATIWDKDLILYAITTLRDLVNKGVQLEKNQPVNITAHNLLTSTERGVGGKAYDALEDAMDRLVGTRIKTNIPASGKIITQGFGLVENFQIVRCQRTNRMHYIELTLSDWLWEIAVHGNKELLAISKEYFKLTSGIERRLYELARKHCGNQSDWSISLQKAHIKSGSTSSLREFKRSIKKIALADKLPDYRIFFDEDKEIISIKNRISMEIKASLNEARMDN